VITGTSTSISNSAKLVYFSAHDSTIRNLLLALQVFDGHWPPLASHFVIEVYAGNTGTFFRMQYDGQLLQLPACETPVCSVSKFADLVNSYTIDTSKACFSN
jgi:hypothetical protein